MQKIALVMKKAKATGNFFCKGVNNVKRKKYTEIYDRIKFLW